MPRSNPPPRKKPKPPRLPRSSGRPAALEGKEASAGKAEGLGESNEVVVDESDIAASSGDGDIASGDAEITLGEAEITLGEAEITFGETEMAEGEFPPLESVDPHPSPHDRVTVVPPLPEHEYVAQMMKGLYDGVPPSRSITPQQGVNMAGATRSSPAAPGEPDPSARSLTLDLSESIAPASLPAIDSTSGRERSMFPTARPISVATPTDEGARFSFGPASGDALELVGVRAQSVKPGPAPKATMGEVRDRFDVGDFSGALALAGQILEKEPESVDALLYAEHCRDVLKQMYISNLGGLRRVPQVAVSAEQLRWLALDHRAGFLLSLVDGRSTFDDVLDVCGMPAFDAIRLLVQLLQQNVIRLL